jgi:CheY-like chemotaxis protein
VLLNLIGNAIKFTEQGSVVVTAGLEPGRNSEEWVRFEVTDTGIGIPEDVKPFLFSMFTQADSSLTRQYGGTGLGLAISRRIVEILGGTIGFDSEAGKGSRFWFSIPLGRMRGSELVRHANRALAGLKVLVVDDNPASLRIIRQQIEGAAGRMEGATDVGGGLALARAAAADGSPFDVAVLDHQMPGDTGYDMATYMRVDPLLAGIKVILATSQPSASLRAEAASVGILYVLAKPIRQRMLVAHIVALVSAAEPGDPVVETDALPEQAETRGLFRVLVVDDVPVNRQLAAAMLGKAGHAVEVAADGVEAVEKIRTGDYDLVLMDVHMPRMNGIAATALVRGLPGRQAGVPIIAMTANAMDGDRGSLLAAGMNDYIAKPFKLTQLTELVETWRQRRKGDESRPVATAGARRDAEGG